MLGHSNLVAKVSSAHEKNTAREQHNAARAHKFIAASNLDQRYNEPRKRQKEKRAKKSPSLPHNKITLYPSAAASEKKTGHRRTLRQIHAAMIGARYNKLLSGCG
jgi:hypothetical protein